jgi:hypothetical protein
MDGRGFLVWGSLTLVAVGFLGFLFTGLGLFVLVVAVGFVLAVIAYMTVGASGPGWNRTEYPEAEDLRRADDPTEHEHYPGPIPPGPGTGGFGL